MTDDQQLWLDNEVIKEAVREIEKAYNSQNYVEAQQLRDKLYVEFLNLIAYDNVHTIPTYLQDMAEIVLQAERHIQGEK